MVGELYILITVWGHYPHNGWGALYLDYNIGSLYLDYGRGGTIPTMDGELYILIIV